MIVEEMSQREDGESYRSQVEGDMGENPSQMSGTPEQVQEEVVSPAGETPTPEPEEPQNQEYEGQAPINTFGVQDGQEVEMDMDGEE